MFLFIPSFLVTARLFSQKNRNKKEEKAYTKIPSPFSCALVSSDLYFFSLFLFWI